MNVSANTNGLAKRRHKSEMQSKNHALGSTATSAGVARPGPQPTIPPHMYEIRDGPRGSEQKQLSDLIQRPPHPDQLQGTTSNGNRSPTRHNPAE